MHFCMINDILKEENILHQKFEFNRDQQSVENLYDLENNTDHGSGRCLQT